MFQGPAFKHKETEEFVIDETLCKIYPNISRTDLWKWLVTPPKMTYLRVNTLKISRCELMKRIKLVFLIHILVNFVLFFMLKYLKQENVFFAEKIYN